MASLKITFLGPDSGTSRHRAHALERLGHRVNVIDPWDYLGYSWWMARWLYHTGGLGVGKMIDNSILHRVQEFAPDLMWVDQGAFLGPRLLRRLRRFCVPIVNYTIDDPFNGRDGRRFRLYLKALPYYDLLVVVREPNVAEAIAAGAHKVIRVWLSADEVAHRLRDPSAEQYARFASEVAFIGTWMPERGPFMAELIRHNVPLSIWGDRWHKAPEWPLIRRHWRAPGLYNDNDYSAAIRSAKICLGLLSKGNRDLHTSRSLEIPSIGSVLCAERTAEHMALYRQGEEAVFWRSAEECAEVCRALLADEWRRLEVARRGRERALHNNYFNEPVMASIVAAATNSV